MQGISSSYSSTSYQLKTNHCCCGGDCCCGKHNNNSAPKMGIIPPKDWKPNPYAGLGPELSPEERLKQIKTDMMKPMYTYQEKTVTTQGIPGVKDGTVRTIAISTPDGTQADISNEPVKKSFTQKVKDFANNTINKVKNFFHKIFHKG